MDEKTIIIFTLTDDPFAPPGYGFFGGSHSAIFNVGQYLIRSGYKIIFITRRISPNHPEMIEFGLKAKLYRIKGGPIDFISYYKVSHYIDEMISNICPIIKDIYKEGLVSFISYNWVSGEIARRVRKYFIGPHIHLVLALGISRSIAGEGNDKISNEWLEYEKNTFNDSDYILCGSTEEKKDLLNFYNKLNSQKISVLNYGIDTDIFCPRPRTQDNYFCRSTKEFQKRINDTF